MLRTSLILFFGQWGLPLPFRQKLMYIMGQPISPPELNFDNCKDSESLLDQQVDDMQARLSEELIRIFDRHKESYGWGHKYLMTLSR